MNTIEVAQSIEELYRVSCQELLAGMNCGVAFVNEVVSLDTDVPLASIDAGSADLEITIGIAMPLSVLALTYPVPDMAVVEDESLEDWISELANQLIGRLKTKLMQHQQEIVLGLPVTTFGVALDEVVQPGPFRFSCYLEVDGEPCACHIGMEFFTDDVNYSLHAEVSDDTLMESDIELF